MFYFKEKRECDFVIFKQEKCEKVVQVCHEVHSENQDREFSGLMDAMQFFNLKEGFIITFDQKDTVVNENKTIYLIPAMEFFVDDAF